jgi:hypothetical protein
MLAVAAVPPWRARFPPRARVVVSVKQGMAGPSRRLRLVLSVTEDPSKYTRASRLEAPAPRHM